MGEDSKVRQANGRDIFYSNTEREKEGLCQKKMRNFEA